MDKKQKTIIGIITTDKSTPEEGPSLVIFQDLAKKFDCEIKIIDPLESKLIINGQKAKFEEKIDVIMPRIGTVDSLEYFFASLYLVEQYRQLSKVPVINPAYGLILGTDKLLQCQLVAKLGFDLPKTAVINSLAMVKPTLKQFSYPLVLKKQIGFGGSGISLVESERSATSVIESFLKHKSPVLVQEYIEAEKGQDYRVHIVGDKVVGGKIRTARRGDFRANVALGAKRRFFQADEKLAQQSLEIAQVTGLEILSVDYIKHKNKFYFMEVNHSMAIGPYEGENKAFAEEILDYCKGVK